MSLKNIIQNPDQNLQAKRPVKVLIVDMVERTKVLSWRSSGSRATPLVQKKNLVAAVTDGEFCTTVTIFEQYAHKVKAGETYFLRGYTLRGRSPPLFINIKKSTRFFQTTPLTPARAVLDEALTLLFPPSARTALSECEGVAGFVTVEGEVMEIIIYSTNTFFIHT